MQIFLSVVLDIFVRKLLSAADKFKMLDLLATVVQL